jgi:hypothetical protein
MRFAIAVLSFGATSFLLGVLAALVKELTSASAKDATGYISRFDPRHKPGKLIEIQLNRADKQVPRKTARRIASGSR